MRSYYLHVLTIWLVISVSPICFSSTLNVPQDYPSIQAAIDAAQHGDIVSVSPGTYVENIDFLGKAITVESTDGAEVTIIDGGNPPDPDFGSVVTFTNGEGLDSILQGFTVTNGMGTYVEYYYPGGQGLFCGGGILCQGASPTLSDNTISGNSAEVFGGGIFCLDYASPAVTNNMIAQNMAGSGGGLSCRRDSSPTLSDNMITGNTSDVAGGISCYDNCSSLLTNNTITGNSTSSRGGGIDIEAHSFPTLTGNTVAENTTSGEGGGIHCYAYSSPTLTNNTIMGNSAAEDGGGIYCGLSSTPILKSNMITENMSIGDGGGIFCLESTLSLESNTIAVNLASNGGGIHCRESASSTLTDNRITENSARRSTGGTGGFGGGISFEFDASPPVLEGNTIAGNTASVSGGGIHCLESSLSLEFNVISGNSASDNGGGIYLLLSNPTLTGNMFSGNTASSCGGGIFCHSSTPTIECNLIVENTALEDGGGIHCTYYSDLRITGNTIVKNLALYGGGIHSTKSSSPMVKNTILWNNLAVTGPEIGIGGTAATATFTIAHSVVEGGEALVHVGAGSTLNWGSGMIESDPLFVDAANNDFHLTFLSPCRGSGNNMAVIRPVDFENDPRIAFGTVDIGADEFYDHLYCTGDFTPGGTIQGKFIGLPGTSPVGLFIGSGIMDPPLQHSWGEFHLESPWLLFPLIPIPADGVLVIPATLPPTPAAYDCPMQALIGWKLSNLFVLKIE